MVDVIAFIMIMAVVSLLSWWWVDGKLSKFISAQRTHELENVGRTIHTGIGKWKFSFVVNREFWVRLTFMALGPAAILGLSVAYAEILPLRVVFVLYVLPAYLAMIVLGIIWPKYGRKALIGFVAGVLATIFYDIVRMILVVGLALPDPIPHIGALWLGAEPVVDGDLWWVGYLWRFFGNGAGMGIVYAMLPKWWLDLKGGWLYGEIIGLGMFVLLFFSSLAQLHLFPLNEFVLINGILGHWAYGLAIGWLFCRPTFQAVFYGDQSKLQSH